MTKNILIFVEELSARLESCCTDKHEATQQAWWLIEKVTSKSRTELLAHPEQQLSHTQEKQLHNFITLRVEQKKPLQYILGSVPFCGLDIIVESPVLIPRPETEEWVSWLITQLEPAKNTTLRILDLCTGSGCIALALAHALPHAQCIGIDINPQAITLANKNKKSLGATNVTFLQSDMFAALPANSTFDLIVSNPPYVTTAEYTQLEKDVSAWEDYAALVAEDNGLLFFKQIATHAAAYLSKQSMLSTINAPRIVVEIGNEQANAVSLFQHAKFLNTRLHHDMHGKQRWIAVGV